MNSRKIDSETYAIGLLDKYGTALKQIDAAIASLQGSSVLDAQRAVLERTRASYQQTIDRAAYLADTFRDVMSKPDSMIGIRTPMAEEQYVKDAFPNLYRVADSGAQRRGRGIRLSEANIGELKRRLEAGEDKTAIAADLGVHLSTVYRYAPVGTNGGSRDGNGHNGNGASHEGNGKSLADVLADTVPLVANQSERSAGNGGRTYSVAPDGIVSFDATPSGCREISETWGDRIAR